MKGLRGWKLAIVVTAVALAGMGQACPESRSDCQIQVVGSFVAASGQTINIYACR